MTMVLLLFFQQQHENYIIRSAYYNLQTYINQILWSMQKNAKYRPITQGLDRALEKLLQQFAYNTQWTDIYNWLNNLETVLKQYPSPFMHDKVLLSKRLNQCINPILPQKLHEQVLKIHQILFNNMKVSVERDINEYCKIFGQQLGTYSLSILPYLAHTTSTKHRLMIMQMLLDYYIDLGYQLIPMMMGIVKVILPVYKQTNDQTLLSKIQEFVQRLIQASGRHYVIASIWSCMLKFSDCRLGGIYFLQNLIPKMAFKKDQQEFQSSHGFSQQQEQLRQQIQLQNMGVQVHHQQYDTMSQQKNSRIQRQSQGLKSSQNKYFSERNITFARMELPEYIQRKQSMQQSKRMKRRMTVTPSSTSPFKQLQKIQMLPPQQLKQKLISNQEVTYQPKKQDEVKKQNAQQVPQQEVKEQQGISQIKQQQKIDLEPKIDVRKIILDKVPRIQLPGIDEIKQFSQQNTKESNFPSHGTLVVNSLIACLQDSSQFIKRSTLDFLFSHLRLKSQVLEQNDRKLLVEAMIRLYRKQQMSVIKRVDRWLLGRQNQDGQYQIREKNEFVIPLITNAFTKILSKQPKNQESCLVPIKIIQNFFMKHDNLIDLTIKNIFSELIRYIFNYSEGLQYSAQILKAGNRFFSNIPSHYPLLLKSLGNKMLEGIKTNNQHLAFQNIKYIDYCYIKLMKHQHGVEQLDYITISLDFLSQGLKLLTTNKKNEQMLYKTYLKDLNLLIYNLLCRRQSVQRFMEKQRNQANKKYFLQTGSTQLPIQRINYQKQIKQQEENQKKSYTNILQNLQIFYIALGKLIKTSPNIQLYEDIYRISSLSMIKILSHIPQNIQIAELPTWFSAIESGIRVASPSVSLAAIDALIQCLMNSQKHPIYHQFKTFIMDDKSKKVKNDYQNLALQKLWALLDYPHMHSRILDLIVAFSKFFPNQFTQTVQKSFETHSDPQKQASIQRFSHFWRLTGFKYKDLLISNRQFAQLNKVGLFKMLDFLDDSNPLVRHAAKNWMMQSLPLFHRVIEPLFYELMKAATDWYVTPKNLIVIKQVYDTKSIFSTFRRIRSLLSSGTYSFLKYIYQQPISDSLQQLRQRITPINESIISQRLPNQGKNKTEQKSIAAENQSDKSSIVIKKQSLIPQIKKLTYIDILIILAVRYIQGCTLQSMGIDFYTGNTAVNTSAIQLLQSLISYIDNPTMCYKFINFILPPLSKVLNQSVLNQQFIIQIQLINLFKTIFFNSSFRKKATTDQIRTFFKNIFTNSMFLQSMLNGLKTPFSYVRSQFVNFITSCIELIANFLDPDECTRCIKEILITYYKIIKTIRISLIQEVLDEEDKKIVKLNEFQNKSKNNGQLLTQKIRDLQSRALQQQKIIKISNNIQQISKTNQILSILHGLSAILNYFYDLDKMSIDDMKFSFSKIYSIMDSFKSILTLGFASSQKSGQLVSKTQFLHNLQTCESILKDLSPVYETILRAWPLSEQFVRIATEQFTSIGSRSFNFQKFSRYNRVLKDLITFVSKQKQSIWGKIFSIMHPMFYRFPKQIMQIYLQLWVRQCTNCGQAKGDPNFKQPLSIRSNVANTEFLMKNIETIVVSNFPHDIIVHAFLESQLLSQINKFYESVPKQRKSSLSFKISQMQAKLIYFLYVYFTYSYIDQKTLTKQSLQQIWNNILKVLQPFRQSKSPTTALWILDMISMCATKYSPKQILTNQKFKSNLHSIVNEQLKYIASIASKSEVVFYDDPTKANFSQNQSGKYRVILPLPPTIFQIFKKGSKERSETDNNLFLPTKAGDFVQLQKMNRLWCFKMLRKLGFQILQNTYLPQKMHFAVIRACQWMQIILPTIQDKATENMIYAECASQVLYVLLEQARLIFIKPLKSRIFKIFDKDDFFICNKNTLMYWAQIIDWVVSFEKNNQTFGIYLDKASLSNSYFTSATTQNKNRIKSFERICFILFSGSQDKYASKINGLLQKIADLIKQVETAHPALLILVLFSIRILILRLSQISLNQLFIDIWPMLLAFLMQIFSKKLVRVQIANQISRNPNLLLAALKLIQMISISNSSEFAHHQWIFIYDYFGIKISLMENTSQLSEIFSQQSQLTQLASFSRSQTTTPFVYKPYVNNYLPQHSINFLADKSEQKIQYNPKKYKVIIKKSFIPNQDHLKSYAYLLAQYLVRLDQYRMKVDLKEVEEVIINDFINLDSFIYKI